MKSSLVLILFSVGVTNLWARPGGTETVLYKSGDETVTGYLALPDSAGPHPAIVVIHEWWGLNDWVKEQTQKFAQQGYVVLAVDLYRGKVAADPDQAHELMRGMPQDRAVSDLIAAFNYLASRPDVNKAKIGSVGWCMGGGLSLQLAIHEPKLAACVVNYGAMPTENKISTKLDFTGHLLWLKDRDCITAETSVPRHHKCAILNPNEIAWRDYRQEHWVAGLCGWCSAFAELRS